MFINQKHNQIVNVGSSNPEGSDDSGGYFADLYHHLLTSPWPLLLLQVALIFLLLNLMFGAAYYFDGGVANARKGSFSDVFFFSIETMATVGYGRMIPVTLVAHILMSLEAFSGLVGFALFTGLAFAKFSRPSVRVRFSRHAVISNRNGVPSLMFRLANMRPSQIVEAQVHVVFARADVTLEGENIWRFIDLNLSRSRNGTFRHSWTIVHPIFSESPLYGSSPESLASMLAEIVVSITGIDGVFMQTVYARHTYRADDLVWGARLADVMIRRSSSFAIDYGKFDAIDQASLSSWSANQLTNVKRNERE